MFRLIFGSRGVCWKSFNFHTVIKQAAVTYTMSSDTSNMSGIPLKEVVAGIKKFADASLAASWDNVGLLIEPTTPKLISRILLTNDLTEDVLEEALTLKNDLIITYHPLIFAPLKSVTTRSWKERIVAKCLENRIAVYSPHTSFDSVKGGVNDWLISAFRNVLKDSKPIQPDANEPSYGMGRLCTLKTKITVEEAVRSVKELTNLPHVRLASARKTDGLICSIAVCAGSGASVLKGVPADLYITGEMLHHDILDATHSGTNVILTNHSDSERGFLSTFARDLHEILNNECARSVTISVSEADRDPLKTV